MNKINALTMRAAAAQATSLLRALGQADRLLLLCEISQGERCVGELEERLDLHQPSLSQHLGVLRNEGLVQTRREGTRIYYSIADRNALAVLKVLYNAYCTKK